MFRRIVVPLDGSELAQSAVDVAVDLAAASHAGLAFCSVVDAIEIAASYPQGTGKALGPWIHDVRRQTASMLSVAAETAARRGLETASAILPQGPAAAAIVAFASEVGADAIVMATHGRSGFARRLLGRVASDVLSQAKCTVLTLRIARPLAAAAEPRAWQAG